jgi:NAD(P)-dependent dehydrogenase (short-subunit alcohol dehydrogenase family)
MPRDLAGAVVVITGASSGIGRAAAQRFAGLGSAQDTAYSAAEQRL